MTSPGAGSRARLLVALLLVAGLAVHLELLRRLGDYVDSDEAVVGLMARHIQAGSARPVFYYGQPYLGSLEAWLGAASGRGRAPTAISMRLMLVGVWLLFAAATWGLARALGATPLGAALALGMVALAPPETLFWHLRFRGGFLLGAALLAGALWAAAVCLAGAATRARAAGFGLLAGLAFWTSQLTAPALAVFAPAVLARTRHRAVLVACFALGSLPLWIHNIEHPLATFRYLAAHAYASAPDALAHLHMLLGTSLPWLCGGVALSGALGWPALRFAGMILFAASLLPLALVRAGPLLRSLRARRLPATLDLALLALLVSLPARRNAELNQLLHWTPLLAALVAAAPAALARRGLYLVPAALVALAALEAAIWLPPFTAIPAEARALVTYLEQQGITSIHAEHRPAYLAAWYSGERIAATPSLSYGYHVDRHPPYTARVEADPRAAWVFEAGSRNEDRFRDLLRAHGVQPRPEAVAIYHVYGAVPVPARVLVGATGGGLGASAAAMAPIRLRLLLAGDAGHPWPASARDVLAAMASDLGEARAARRVMVWLGDNVYPSGLPAVDEADPERAALERLLDQQLGLARAAGAELVMVPGNHDWDRNGARGWPRVKAAESYVAERGPGFAHYLPGGGCPGPASLDLAPSFRLIALNSPWFFRPGPDPARGGALRPEGPDDGCGEVGSAPGAEGALAELSGLLERSRQHDVLIVAHHPLRSWGPHGTRFGAGADRLLPCLAAEDLCSEAYGSFRSGLEAVLATSRRAGRGGLLLYAAGHDHTLQVLQGDPAAGADYHLVSGTTSDPTRVTRGPDTLYASARHGYLRLDILESGERWLAVIEAGPDDRACLAWEQRLEPGAPR